MNKNANTTSECDALGNLLVEYADAATSGAESAHVERHVAQCELCRRELRALRRSLCVLESVWTEASRLHLRRVQPPTESGNTNTKRRCTTSARLSASQASLGGSGAYKWLAALGGLAAVVALLIGLYRTAPWANDGMADATNSEDRSATDSGTATTEIGLDDLDIEAFIQRQEQSARLAASAQFLTALAVEPRDAQKAQRYLREAYGIESVDAPSAASGEL